jgi:UDP-glucuronate decarboxylase
MQAQNNEKITLWGDGSQEVSFIHAADLAPNILALAENDVNATPINIVSTQYVTLKELAENIISLTKSKSKSTYINNTPISKKNRVFSSQSAVTTIAFKEVIPFKQGLKSTVESIKEIHRIPE